jgi:uncharacterized protein YuzE
VWVPFSRLLRRTHVSYADDSELTDDDVIIRYQDDEVVGFTVLHASKWRSSCHAKQ